MKTSMNHVNILNILNTQGCLVMRRPDSKLFQHAFRGIWIPWSANFTEIATSFHGQLAITKLQLWVLQVALQKSSTAIISHGRLRRFLEKTTFGKLDPPKIQTSWWCPWSCHQIRKVWWIHWEILPPPGHDPRHHALRTCRHKLPSLPRPLENEQICDVDGEWRNVCDMQRINLPPNCAQFFGILTKWSVWLYVA